MQPSCINISNNMNLKDILENLKECNAHEIEKSIKEFISGKNLPVGEIMPVLRFFITGTLTGPSVPDIMDVIGKEESMNRIGVGIKNFPHP
mgnify:CR=1 FL=1